MNPLFFALVALAHPALAHPALARPALVPPALAQQPPAPTVDVRGWDVATYNNHLMEVEYTALLEVLAATQAHLDARDEQSYQAWVAELDRVTAAAIARLGAMPGFQGDTSLRDVLLGGHRALRGMLDAELAELHHILVKPEVRSADVARAEVLLRQVNASSQALQDQMVTTQQAFAARHGMILVPPPPRPELNPGPEFTWPGLPPAGSPLTAEQHASLAMRYHNELTQRTNTMLLASNTFLEASSQPGFDCEAARATALAAVQGELAQVRTVGDWLGDAALVDATVGFGELLEGQLQAQYGQFCAVFTNPRVKPAQVNAANRVAQDASAAAQAALNAWHSTAAGFRERWGLSAWEAWLRQQGRLPAP